MAYGLGARFAPTPKYYTLLDPGAYQTDKNGLKQNVAPFLSTSARNTDLGARLWTHAIYNQEVRRKIPNCSSIMSKQPRFPYEAFSAEDLEEILCKCGIINPCECPTRKEKVDVICQGKVKRRIYKGPTPPSVLGDEGLSTPSRKDHGFNILTDGSQQRIRDEVKVECPPFYDARVNESTAFYRGCKWSQWTSKRSQKNLEVRPGPADYYFKTRPTKEEMCAEKVRAFKRKTSKQLRFIEIVQQKNRLEDFPGPATYTPMPPKGTDLQFTGCKAKRFPTSNLEVHPGPADHSIRRDFDPVHSADVSCHAILPQSAGFGIKAKRFKEQCADGPSPTSYNINYRLCRYVHCRTAPFGTSAKRFKEEIIEESDEDTEEIISIESLVKEHEETAELPCPSPTWEFKSKTIRMKPIVTKQDEPSPADFPQTNNKIERSPHFQYIAPFCSSEGRFRPWYSWIPVHGTFITPGPANYRPEKAKCPPTFVHGPLYRAKRFPPNKNQNPAPNEYQVNDGIETILATHNHRLKDNIKNQYKFIWQQPVEQKSLNFEEQEAILLNNSISLLDIQEVKSHNTQKRDTKTSARFIKDVAVTATMSEKPKMLRTFLYARPVANYI